MDNLDSFNSLILTKCTLYIRINTYLKIFPKFRVFLIDQTDFPLNGLNAENNREKILSVDISLNWLRNNMEWCWVKMSPV